MLLHRTSFRLSLQSRCRFSCIPSTMYCIIDADHVYALNHAKEGRYAVCDTSCQDVKEHVKDLESQLQATREKCLPGNTA